MLKSIRMLSTGNSDESVELKAGPGSSKKTSSGRANRNILDTAKSNSSTRLKIESEAYLHVGKKVDEARLRCAKSGNEVVHDKCSDVTPSSRENFDFEKSNFLGQKIALHQKVKCLETRLAQKEQMLTKKTASLQLAIQEYRNLSGRLNECKANKDAAILRSRQLYEQVLQLQEERAKAKLRDAEQVSDRHAQARETAAAWKVRQSVWSECQAITALSSLACKAQRRVLELERKVHADVDSLGKKAQPSPDLQAAICKNLRQQLKHKDEEIQRLRGAFDEVRGQGRKAACTIRADDA